MRRREPTTERRTFSRADEVRYFPQGRIEVLRLGESRICRLVLEPGWRSAQAPGSPARGQPEFEGLNLGYHVAGRLAMRLEDGSEFIAQSGDVLTGTSLQDAWVVGNEPVVVVDFGGPDAGTGDAAGRAGRQREHSRLYTTNHRQLQWHFDATRLADRIEERLVHAKLSAEDRAFIERCDMFFLASSDAQGRVTCSYKGGEPGFVRIEGTKELVFPCYDGNGMYLSSGNILDHPQIGLLFIDFTTGQRLRVNGTAEIEPVESVFPRYPEAQFIVRVAVRDVFPNCSRYVHRLQPVARSEFLPRPGATAPVPDWKRAEWARDVLPAGDPARTPPGAVEAVAEAPADTGRRPVTNGS